MPFQKNKIVMKTEVFLKVKEGTFVVVGVLIVDHAHKKVCAKSNAES